MTEEEWLACEDPTPMLNFIQGRISARKVQLFAVACCRRTEFWVELGLPEEDRRAADYRNAVEVAERYADGAATDSELNDAHWMADRSVLYLGYECPSDPFMDLTRGNPEEVAIVALRVQQAFLDLDPWTPDDPRPAPAEIKAERERVAQSGLLRDIIGNPFRPVTFTPEWRTDTATAIARQMYESRDFSAMPILADALQDAGCDADDILSHCRDPHATHVRGCWVVDLVLDRN